MNAKNLSDFQLYSLSRNKKLDQAIREAIETELKARHLGNAEFDFLDIQLQQKLKADDRKLLKTWQKTLIILFPFSLEIHAVVSGLQLAKNRQLRWRQYWKYICLGYALWTVAVIILAISMK